MVFSRKNLKKYSRKGSKRTYKRKSYATKKKSPLKRMVKAEIYRTLETKERQYQNTGLNLWNVAAGSTLVASQIVCTPYSVGLDIQQGVGNGSRVGNKVETRKLTLKGGLACKPYDVVTNPNPQPTVVKVWFYYDKTNPTGVPNPLSDFFDFNNSTQPMTGALFDSWAAVNTDKYHVLKTKEFKLGYASGMTGAGQSTIAGTSAPLFQNWANNDFKMYQRFSFDLTKYCPKNVVFNDNSSAPTSRNVCMLAVCMEADNTISAESRSPVQMSLQLEYKYKDA